MSSFLEKQFKLSENGTNVRRELIAGLTTFLTMAYILATIPRMLEPLGFGQASILTMMVLLVAATSIGMGLYTNRPFALAPGLGSVGIVASFVTNDGVDPAVAAGVIFTTVAYVCGWAHFMVVAQVGPLAAFLTACAPFIAVDFCKIVAAVVSARAVRAIGG